MTCEKCNELMMDVLYGEEVRPRIALPFFRHLEECPVCGEDYRELMQVRERLGEWKLDDLERPRQDVHWGWRWRRQWWPTLQKIAAGLLIVYGAVSLLQTLGGIGTQRGPVTEQQLKDMVHDLVLARQDESLRFIGEALLDIKEELDARNRLAMEEVYQDMYSLEQRTLQTLEDSTSQMRRVNR